MKIRLKLTARLLPDGQPFTVTGQEARTLRLLVERGSRGLAAWDTPSGPPWRLAAYVFDLRRNFGLPIATESELHSGGHHARYKLTGAVEIVSVTDPAKAVA